MEKEKKMKKDNYDSKRVYYLLPYKGWLVNNT